MLPQAHLKVLFGKMQRWPFLCEEARDVNLQLAVRLSRTPIRTVTYIEGYMLG